MRPLALMVPLLVLVLLAGCAQPPGASSSSSGSSLTATGTADTASRGPTGTATTTTGTTSAVRPAEWTPQPWVESPCSLPPMTPGVVPPVPEFLVLDSQGGLTRFAWRNGHATPAMHTGQGIALVAVAGTGAVTADRNGTAWRLVSRSMDLHERASVAVPEVTALASDGKTVFAATRWNLTAYDLDLHELGRLPLATLNGQGPGKAIDAIALSGGHAYLLDDVVMPFWVFRVDVRQPSAMRQVFAHDVSSTGSPQLQWLNATAGAWYVEENFYGMGGGGRSVVPLALADGAEGKAITVAGSSYPFLPDDPSPRREQGYTVYDTEFTLPGWAIVGHGNASLARVDVVGGAIRRSCATPLQGDTHLAAAGLYVFTWSRAHLQVWDARGTVHAGAEAALPIPASGLWPVGGQLP